MLAHYRTVARGGAGTLVTEALRVHPSDGRRESAIWMHEPDVVPSLRRLADAVHAEGALLIAQLNHAGRQHFSRRVPTLWAPSAIACPRRSVVGFKLIKARQQPLGPTGAVLNAQVEGVPENLFEIWHF